MIAEDELYDDKPSPVQQQGRKRRKKERDKSWLCAECGKGFAFQSVLLNHMRLHTGGLSELNSFWFWNIRVALGILEKPFRCEYCDKSFAQRTTLTIHIRTHTGQKPFVCAICDKGFTSQVKHQLNYDTFPITDSRINLREIWKSTSESTRAKNHTLVSRVQKGSVLLGGWGPTRWHIWCKLASRPNYSVVMSVERLLRTAARFTHTRCKADYFMFHETFIKLLH